MARRSSNFAKHHFCIDSLYTSTSQTVRGEGPVVAFCFVLPVSNLSQTSTFVKHNKDELVGKKKRYTPVSGIVSWSLPSPHNLSILLPCQPVLTSYMSGIALGFGNEGLNRKKERDKPKIFTRFISYNLTQSLCSPGHRLGMKQFPDQHPVTTHPLSCTALNHRETKNPCHSICSALPPEPCCLSSPQSVQCQGLGSCT